MLPLRKSARKHAARHPFRSPLWDDDHPDFRRIDATLPADHHARWLVRVVAQLDLTAVRLHYAGYGSLAYPVELLLAFVLFMYSKGLVCPAEWVRQARYDDQSKWLLRGLQPSRSLLYAFRDRVEPFLDAWHQQLLRWALVEGLTTATRGSLDGTFVASLASRHQLAGVGRVDRRLLLLRLLVWLDGLDATTDLGTHLERLPQWTLTALLLGPSLQQAGVAAALLGEMLLRALALLELVYAAPTTAEVPHVPAWVPHSRAGRQRVLQRYEKARQRLTQRLQPYQNKQPLSKKDQQTVKRLKVSLTDAEAALGWDKLGTYRPLYNVPLVQATDAPLTLAWDVLPCNNDEGLLPPMMAKVQAQVGHALTEVVVDGGLVSVTTVAWCEQHGITVYAPAAAPPPSAAVAAAAAAPPATPAPANGSAAKAAKLPKAAFRYDGGEGVYYCPQGKRLPAVSHTTVQRQNGLSLPMVVHRASGQDCQSCPQQPGCTSNPQKGRVVKRYEGEEALERLQQRMAELSSQQVYRLRRQTVERGYADLKEHRGLRVFRGFGRQRARAQVGLVILASNGLSILRLLQQRQSTQQGHAPPEKQPA